MATDVPVDDWAAEDERLRILAREMLDRGEAHRDAPSTESLRRLIAVRRQIADLLGPG